MALSHQRIRGGFLDANTYAESQAIGCPNRGFEQIRRPGTTHSRCDSVGSLFIVAREDLLSTRFELAIARAESWNAAR